MRVDRVRAAATGVEFMDFTWPSPNNISRLGDIIDDCVDEHYFLSDMWKDRVVPSDNPMVTCKLQGTCR